MNRYKYPRTPHLPWSLGKGDDDKVLENTNHFENMVVVATEKMDGECTTIYSDGYSHARSMGSKNHPSRDWVKRYFATFSHDIPDGWRICGENMYAKHSIHYKYLPHYFLVFAIWNENNVCLSWRETLEWCGYLGLTHVPMLYYYDEEDGQSLWDVDIIKMLPAIYANPYVEVEGYVVRNAERFHYDDLGMNVAKYVREGHVQTDKHWMKQKMVVNLLKE